MRGAGKRDGEKGWLVGGRRAKEEGEGERERGQKEGDIYFNELARVFVEVQVQNLLASSGTPGKRCSLTPKATAGGMPFLLRRAVFVLLRP